jgi:hypothetical protein
MFFLLKFKMAFFTKKVSFINKINRRYDFFKMLVDMIGIIQCGKKF